MKRSLYLFAILLFLGIFAFHFTVYMAHADEAKTVKESKSNADNRQTQPNPEPADVKSFNSSRSNSERQIQPNPEPVEINPCANTRCQFGYHCLPLSQVGFCAKDEATRCTVTCYGISGDMHGSCADYAHQLATHSKCSCIDSK